MDNWKITIWALLFLLGGSALKGWAQDDRRARAERIYEHLVEGRGDSIYAVRSASMNTSSKAVVTASMPPSTTRRSDSFRPPCLPTPGVS